MRFSGDELTGRLGRGISPDKREDRRRAMRRGRDRSISANGSIMRDFNSPGRSAMVASNGMAATSAPRATLAALDVLRGGGNAVDAAIAAVAMQCVVEPQSTGIGGDCFVMYSKGGALPVALNGSGRAPGKARLEWFLDRGVTQIEVPMPHAVTIPGAVDAWCTLNREYGTRPLS